MAPLPLASARSTSHRYRAVLPDPVTPWRRKGLNAPFSINGITRFMAALCSRVGTSGRERSTPGIDDSSFSALLPALTLTSIAPSLLRAET